MFWVGEFDAHEGQPVGEGLHDDGAQDGARDRADAAREGRAAHDGRGDDVQLISRADIERGAVQAGRRDRAAATAHSRPISM